MRIRLILGLFLACSLGCGSGGPFQYVPVTGVVLYEDGSTLPAEGFQLNFFALDAAPVEGASPRPAIAHVNAEGKFDCVTSYKYCDGLVPGRHRVAFVVGKADGKQRFVPREYTSRVDSPLIVDTADAPLEIRVPKP